MVIKCNLLMVCDSIDGTWFNLLQISIIQEKQDIILEEVYVNLLPFPYTPKQKLINLWVTREK